MPNKLSSSLISQIGEWVYLSCCGWRLMLRLESSALHWAASTLSVNHTVNARPAVNEYSIPSVFLWRSHGPVVAESCWITLLQEDSACPEVGSFSAELVFWLVTFPVVRSSWIQAYSVVRNVLNYCSMASSLNIDLSVDILCVVQPALISFCPLHFICCGFFFPPGLMCLHRCFISEEYRKDADVMTSFFIIYYTVWAFWMSGTQNNDQIRILFHFSWH